MTREAHIPPVPILLMRAADGPYCPYIHCGDDRPRQHPWSMPQRRLTHWLLVTSLEGEERLRVAGVDVRVPSGSSYLIQPGVLADIGSATGNRPVWLHFDLMYDAKRAQHPDSGGYRDHLGERAAFMQADAMTVFGIELAVLAPKAVQPLLRAGVIDVVRTWQGGGPLAQVQAAHRLSGLLLNWVAHAWRSEGMVPATAPAARIARAEALARGQLGTDFDVDDFAAAAGYSRSRFCAVYQQVRGASPGRWLRDERLLLAEELLVRPELPVASVGAMVGYPDPTVFGRVFRAHRGVTPGEWRRTAARDRTKE